MLSNHLILCSLLFLWPSVFPSIGIFSSSHQVGQSIGSFSFSISPFNEYSGLVSFIKASRQRLGFPSGPAVQNPPAVQEPGRSGFEPLKEGTAAHCSGLPGKSQAQRNLAGYSSQGRKESDTTRMLTDTLMVECC